MARRVPDAPVKKVAIVRLVQTCSACPSQWDAWDAAGQQYYIRYRYGWLSVEAVSGPDWYKNTRDEIREVFRYQSGDDLDGEMTSAEMAWATESVLDFSGAEVPQ